MLSLAPHNIRYDELVAEGINPAILKQLYEEIGIKVAATDAPKTPVATPPVAEPVGPSTAQRKSAGAGQLAGLQNQVEASKPALQQPALIPSPAPVSAPSQPETEKPMERKELIAKMLAAKAANAARNPVSKAAPKEVQTPATNVITPPMSNEVQNNTNGVTVREKNKAQTELARRRIEELKKQALLKKQQQSQQAIQSDTSPSEEQSSNISSPAVQHPLPIRPPAPQILESPGIPGLFMTESQQGPEAPISASLTPGIAVDATPVTRITQRKRPRAADFDEPVPALRKHSSHEVARPRATEKLIIDISDEESLYGDDEGEAMDMDSSPDLMASSTAAMVPGRPSLQKQNSDTRTSTSTPQGTMRLSDEESIRQRDLEIQAMHRKIAKLEQKRLAKLAASRTQSPRIFEDSDDSPAAVPPSVAETKSAEAPRGAPLIKESTPQELAAKEGMAHTTTRNHESADVLAESSGSLSSVHAGTYTDAESEAVPRASISVSGSVASTSSSDSLGSDSESLNMRSTDNKVTNENEKPSTLSQVESSGSAMEQSSDSYDSAETSSDEEESEGSDAQVEADLALSSKPEPMDIDTSSQLVRRGSQPPIHPTDTESKLKSEDSKSANDHRETSEESDFYEPSEGQPTSVLPESVCPYDTEDQNRPSDKDSVMAMSDSDAYEPPEPDELGTGFVSLSATNLSPSNAAAADPAEVAAISPSLEEAPMVTEAIETSHVPAFESGSGSHVGSLGV